MWNIKKYYSINLLLVLILLCGCVKNEGERFTIISGTAVDFHTKIPLANIGLIIEHCEYVLIAPTKCEIIDTIYTDDSGYFEYNLTSYYPEEILDAEFYQISAIASDKYSNSDVYRIEIEKSNNIDIELKQLKELRLKLTDTSNVYDELRISISESDYAENNAFFQKEIVLKPEFKKEKIMKLKPDTRHLIIWQYYTKGVYSGNGSTHIEINNQESIDFELRF
jgi:hypothetical protein